MALIDAVLAVRAGESRDTVAGVVVDAVDAAAVVHAGRRGAVLIVDFTVCPGEAKRTSAGVGVDIVVARGTILTRV